MAVGHNASNTLQIKSVSRQKMNQLVQNAKRWGMTPEQYVKQLVEDDLAISRRAQTRSFAKRKKA
jgi:hypothetical protein